MPFFKLIFLLSALGLGVLIWWLIQLNKDIDAKLKNGWFPESVSIYAQPVRLFLNQQISIKKTVSILYSSGFTEQPSQSKLYNQQFSVLSSQQCSQFYEDFDLFNNCIVFRKNLNQVEGVLHVILFKEDTIQKLFVSEALTAVREIKLPEKKLLQLAQGKPIISSPLKLSEVPLYCLQAITAIEDSNFLEHSGVSLKGIFRAVISNLKALRWAQGGSTITQQLIKNYFLTHERSLKRKFKEFFMAILIETKSSKDQILQAYLNVIYMGQQGAFQVRGYSAASKFYYNQPLKDLNLAQCSLLASIVNSPGLFNPFKNPKFAKKRRSLVLNRMRKFNMISEKALSQANLTALPDKQHRTSIDNYPYYNQAIQKELKTNNITIEPGYKIYSELVPEAQAAALKVTKKNITLLEKKLPDTLKGKLQSLLISINIHDGSIISLTGGRGYRQSQYNRALESSRQVGSLMKPFVYLAALESIDDSGNPYTPLTIISDEPFTYKYDNNSWSPKNYSETFHGNIPLFYGLKNSINVATARLGLKVGLNTIIDVAKRLGVQSTIKPTPSLTLGSYELSPLEVTQAYLNIANLGKSTSQHVVKKVLNANDEVIYLHKPIEPPQQLLRPAIAASLISMLQQTTKTGTARSLSTWRGFSQDLAGKTGTTNNYKDAWFVGFSPDILTLVWVGFDNNDSHGLTGSSGALPIWSDYTKATAYLSPKSSFAWPEEGIKWINLDPEDILKLYPEAKEYDLIKTQLIEAQ